LGRREKFYVDSLFLWDGSGTAITDYVINTHSISWGKTGSTFATDIFPGWKVPKNITITEVYAYTGALTVAFNIEQRSSSTPIVAGTDIMTSDATAITTGVTSTTFDVTSINAGDILTPVITTSGNSVNVFSITITYRDR